MVDDVLSRILIEADSILEKVKASKLAAYDQTQRMLRNSNVEKDLDYQRTYKGFYAMGRKSPEWYAYYFGLLEREKTNVKLAFEPTLCEVFKSSGRVEASFLSKLVATVRPDQPVYDDWVLQNLKISRPRAYKAADVRLSDALSAYRAIDSFHKAALPSEAFRNLEIKFDRAFEKFAHFTPAKKLDIFLWQWRR